MLYKQIAKRMAGDIIKRKRPGERLQGVRELATSENISLMTARNVYQYLVEQGLVVSKQGAGTFVAHGLSESVIDMAAIRPPEELMLWVNSHLHFTIEGLNAYDPPQGYEPLRQQASKWLRSAGIDQSPIITSGSQQALFLLGLVLLKKGDVIAVEDPGYMGAVRIFESLGAIVKPIPYISSHEDLERIRDLNIRLLYTMPQGHIPTGKSIPEGLRDELIGMAADNNYFIIEDDPFSDIVGIKPLKAHDVHDRVIYIKSLSYILGPGLRIGFAVFPKAIESSLINLKEINDLSTSGVLQRALYSILLSSKMKEHIERLNGEFARRRAYLTRTTRWTAEGPCLWIKTPVPSRIFQEKLFELGVKITPGDIYGSQWSNHIRLSVLTPSRRGFEHAIEIIQEYLDSVRGPSLTEF